MNCILFSAEEIKSPNRAEKRPIDSTLSDSEISSSNSGSSGSSSSSSSSAGLQVTGAPVPLFAAQDVAMAATNIGVQNNSTGLANGTVSCQGGIGFPMLPATSAAHSPAFPGHNLQARFKALFLH